MGHIHRTIWSMQNCLRADSRDARSTVALEKRAETGVQTERLLSLGATSRDRSGEGRAFEALREPRGPCARARTRAARGLMVEVLG